MEKIEDPNTGPVLIYASNEGIALFNEAIKEDCERLFGKQEEDATSEHVIELPDWAVKARLKFLYERSQVSKRKISGNVSSYVKFENNQFVEITKEEWEAINKSNNAGEDMVAIAKVDSEKHITPWLPYADWKFDYERTRGKIESEL
jgi:hypothetical protein